MYHHLFYNCRTFYNAAVRSDISFQYRKTAGLAVRIVNRADNFRIEVYTVFDVFAYCFACYCHAFCMKKSFFVQLVHNCINTACFVQIFHISRTCRCKVAEVRCLCTDLICKAYIKIHTDFMSDCRKMKHTVGRTSKCHIYCQCVQNGFFCHDVARTDISAIHFHNLHTRMFCKTNTLGIYSRNGSISTKSHTKNLCQTVHRVCSIHTGTGSTCRTCFVLKFCKFVFCNLACRIRSDSFKHTGKTCLVSMNVACHHRSTTYEYSRNIQSGSRHQKSGYVFVTVWNHNQGIKLMSHCHCLCRVCNQISCYQRVFHSDVSHCDTVTDSDRREYDRCTASHCNPLFYGCYDLVKVHMARYDLIVGTYDSD